ncbi:hypothetical protein SS50377_27284 [Spironucleus salmonicida]|uniref:Uncharacterized protein n=1 Tax=Spironucleus salmonicida TaxID=348837 RepID=V6M1A8_9EUKA|nr:hypothetical protein SS50377_28820 [Spironucleus salmonicida]KAH0570990.1 hypothetical protein SS50377_27284 [Spironucleus salmonicida]|eukprot:EST46964.1 Hypothetical protein SS50377_12999 [Spironucleus salmonicida]
MGADLAAEKTPTTTEPQTPKYNEFAPTSIFAQKAIKRIRWKHQLKQWILDDPAETATQLTPRKAPPCRPPVKHTDLAIQINVSQVFNLSSEATCQEGEKGTCE